MTARSRLARGAASLAALLLLVVGVPAFLAIVVGWPLPHGTITFSGIGDAFDGTSPIPDSFWFGALACLAWLMWLRVTIAVLAETRAAIAGRPASDHGVRRVVGALVAAALLTVVSTRSVRPAAAEPVRPLPAAAAPDTTAAPPPPSSPSASPVPTWTVARNDTLWDIAERALGDPLRWRDIYDLNEGRPQTDGGTLSDPNLLRPGWILQLPADATAAPGHADVVTVQPGDTLSGIAQRALGDPNRYPELFAANAGITQPDGDSLQDPNLIRPGWQIELAPTPLDSAASPPPSILDTDPALTAPPATTELSPPTTTVDVPLTSTTSPTEVDDERGSDPIRSNIVLAGLLSAGAVAALSAARVRRRRIRSPNASFSRPDPTLIDVESRTRRAAAGGPAPDVAALLSALAVLPDNVRVGALSIDASGAIEVLLDHAIDDAPPGWSGDASGRLLTATAEQGVPPPLVGGRWAFVTVGVSGDREVLIDLVVPGITCIEGDGAAALALFRTLLFGIATSPLNDSTDVIYVGRSHHPSLERLRVMPATEAVESLTRLAHAQRTAAAHHDDTSVVFLDARFVDEPTAEAITALGHDGLAVIVHGRPDKASDRLLRIDDERIAIEPTGLTIEPATSPGEMAAWWSLLDDDPPPGSATEVVELPLPASSTPAEVVIHVLGAVRTDGIDAPFSRRIAQEVAVYLVTHPAGADEERLMTALWPDRSPARSSFNQAVSRARVTLGVGSSGEHHLPHLEADGRYRVAATVTTDLQQLHGLLVDLRVAAVESTVGTAVELLNAIDGLPFTNRGPGYEWAHAEGLVGWAQAVVSDTAHLVAEHGLIVGDASLAVRAARAGLRACPADEVLYRDLMRAQDASGNRVGVEAAFIELCAVIEAEVPQDDVHPETWELYTSLVPRALRGVS